MHFYVSNRATSSVHLFLDLILTVFTGLHFIEITSVFCLFGLGKNFFFSTLF